MSLCYQLNTLNWIDQLFEKLDASIKYTKLVVLL